MFPDPLKGKLENFLLGPLVMAPKGEPYVSRSFGQVLWGNFLLGPCLVAQGHHLFSRSLGNRDFGSARPRRGTWVASLRSAWTVRQVEGRELSWGKNKNRV